MPESSVIMACKVAEMSEFQKCKSARRIEKVSTQGTKKKCISKKDLLRGIFGGSHKTKDNDVKFQFVYA